VALDALQDAHRRHLDVAVDRGQAAFGLQARPQRLMHLQRHLAVLAAVFGGLGHIDLANGIWCTPLPHRSS
jgi:hypothetical protein